MPRVRLSLCLGLGLAVSVAACGGDSTGPGGTDPTASDVAVVEVSPSAQAFTSVGLTLQLSAVARTASGTVVSGQAFSWVSSNAGVASVNASSGLVTTVGNGTATISARAGSASGSASITVQQEVASLTLQPDSLVLLTLGDTARFTVRPLDANGQPVSGTAAVAWSVSDTAVASVGTGGTVTSRFAAGAATVRVTAGALQREARVVVRSQLNPSCVAPVGVPARPGAAAAPPTWLSVADRFAGSPSLSYNMAETVAVDVDMDGDQDIVGFASNFPWDGATPGGQVSIWENRGGTFVDATVALLGSTSVRADHSRQFEVADFNRDGRMDVFAAQHGWDVDPFPGAPDLLLLSGASGLRDASTTHLSPVEPTGFSHASASADVDCDGDLDVFAGVLHGGSDHLYLNSGAGQMVAADAGLPYSSSQGWSFTSAEFCDLDRDGAPDLILGGWPPKSTELLFNDGFGRFRHAPASMLPRNVYGSATTVVDINCGDEDFDGWNDLYVALTNQDYSSGTVEIWRNQRGRSLEAVPLPVPPVRGGWAVRATPIDFNRDGWPDIYSPLSGGAYATHVYVSTGTPGQYTRAPWPYPGLDRAMGLVDADGDGRPDLFWLGGGPHAAELFLTR
ncbi:MAG: FG-GAP-like repeat-containing protein [Longimicrobiales bacterium]